MSRCLCSNLSELDVIESERLNLSSRCCECRARIMNDEISTPIPARCGGCRRPGLTVLDFGKDKNRLSGRNLRCKQCNRDATRFYREQRRPEIKPIWSKKTTKPAGIDLVRVSLQSASLTQAEIILLTRLTKDQLGIALAELMLNTREVESAVVNKHRVYFLKTQIRRRA